VQRPLALEEAPVGDVDRRLAVDVDWPGELGDFGKVGLRYPPPPGELGDHARAGAQVVLDRRVEETDRFLHRYPHAAVAVRPNRPPQRAPDRVVRHDRQPEERPIPQSLRQPTGNLAAAAAH